MAFKADEKKIPIEYRSHSIVSRVTSGSKARLISGFSDNTSEQFSSVTEDISSAGEELTRSTSVEEAKVIETIKSCANSTSRMTHNDESSKSRMQSHHYYHYILDTRKSKYEFGLNLDGS